MKGFKLISEAEDSYHIQHKNGRKFTVDKKGLNKKAHEQIKKLACGGAVQNFDDGGTPQALQPSDDSGAQQPAVNDVLTPNLPAARSDTEMAADQDRQQIVDRYNRMVPTTDKMIVDGGAQNFDPQYWKYAQDAIASDKETNAAAASNQAKNIHETNAARLQAGLQPLPAPDTVQTAEAPKGTDLPPVPGGAQPGSFQDQSQAQPVDPLSQYTQAQNKNLQGQQQDISNYMKQSGASEAAGSQAFNDYFKQSQQLESPEQIYAKHDAANKELLSSLVDNKIDPNRYVNNMSTGQKILAGVAMALGGAGAGRGGTNLAYEHLQNAVNADINSQLNDQTNKMNLYKMNRQNANDEVQARLMTQNQMFTMVQAKLAQAASQSANADRRMNASNMVRQLQSQIDGNNLQLALQGGQKQQSGPNGLSAQDPATLVPIMAKMKGLTPEQQTKVYDEIDVAKTVAMNKDRIKQAFLDASKDVRSVSAIAGYEPGSVMKLKQSILPLFKDIDSTVRQAAMDETFQNVVPARNDTPDRIKQRSEGLDNWLNSKSQGSAALGAGINLNNYAMTANKPTFSPQQPQSQQYLNYVKANQNNPDPQVQKRVVYLSQKLGVPLNNFQPNQNKKASAF